MSCITDKMKFFIVVSLLSGACVASNQETLLGTVATNAIGPVYKYSATVEMPKDFSADLDELERYRKEDGGKGLGSGRFMLFCSADFPRMELMSFRDDNSIADLASFGTLLYNEYLARKINGDIALSAFDLQVLDVAIRANYLYTREVCQAFLYAVNGVVEEGEEKRILETLGGLFDSIYSKGDTNTLHNVLALLGEDRAGCQDSSSFTSSRVMHAMEELCLKWRRGSSPTVNAVKYLGKELADNTFTVEPGFVLTVLMNNIAVDIRKPRCWSYSDNWILRRNESSTIKAFTAFANWLNDEKPKAVDRRIPFSFSSERINMYWKEGIINVFYPKLLFLSHVNADISSQILSVRDREGFGGLKRLIESWRPALRTLCKTYLYLFYDFPVFVMTKSAYDDTERYVGFFKTDREQIKSLAYRYVMCLAGGKMTQYMRSNVAADFVLQYHGYLKKVLGPEAYQSFATSLKMPQQDELQQFEFDERSNDSGKHILQPAVQDDLTTHVPKLGVSESTSVNNKKAGEYNERGDKYRYGIECNADKRLAMKYYRLAADHGHAEAQCALGRSSKGDLRR